MVRGEGRPFVPDEENEDHLSARSQGKAPGEEVDTYYLLHL